MSHPTGGGTPLELALRRVDVLARRCMAQAPDADATAMLRMWGELVDSAADLWTALPAATRADRDVMAQLQTTAHTYHRTQLATGWPGDGGYDAGLLRAAQEFTRAAAHAQTQAPSQVRTRVMHALYLTSHAVGRSLHAQLNRDLLQLTTTQAGNPDVSRLAGAWRRLQAMEQLTGDYLRSAPAVASGPGAARGAADSTARVAHALAVWDVQAHRTLTSDPVPANVTMVCAVQEIIARTALEHVRSNSLARRLEPVHQAGRLTPNLRDAVRAWTEARTGWSRLTPTTVRADHDLALAAAQLRQQLTRTSPASARAPLDDREFATMTAVVRHAGVSLDLASMTADIAATNPDLKIGALVAARRIGRAQDLALDNGLLQPADHELTERQVRLNEGVPLPTFMRHELMDHANGVVAASLAVASAAGAFDQQPAVAAQQSAPGPPPEDGQPRSTVVQDRLWGGPQR